jgi:hypothetical protein
LLILFHDMLRKWGINSDRVFSFWHEMYLNQIVAECKLLLSQIVVVVTSKQIWSACWPNVILGYR